MPNWVYNNLSVKAHSKQELDDFKKKYFTKENGEICFDFNKVIAEPQTIEQCEKEFICDCEEKNLEVLNGRNWFNWYAWRVAKWGTKWNSCDNYIESETDTELVISFATAWSKPRNLISALKEQNKHLKISYWGEY